MNDIVVRFPGLLDAELNESERLRPLSASLTLNLYGSSEATITLPEDAPYIRIHDWVSLYTQNGFAGIFRVTNISRNFKRNLEITLLHGIDILSDSVWAEQDKFSGTMEEFLTKALNFQTHLVNGVKPWVLGTCEDYSTTFTDKEMNYDRLSTLLEGLIEEGGDYYYEYNMSTFPWTLNVRRKSSVVWSEFRLSRNVTTANVTYNDADLCTRLIVSVNNKTTEERGDYTVPSETVYPDQSAHGLIPDSSKAPGSTAEVTSNETTIKTYDSESGQRNWGIVVKTADIDLAEIRQTWPSVDAWAANFMGLRSQPSVQIQIDGEELAQLSGDNWDELALGRNCRVCLPTYSPGYFNERVVSVTYPDLFSRPSHVTVSLANALPKFSESITRIADKADSAASSARSAGRYAASAEELTQWSQIVEYYGEALDGTGVMTLYRSGIEMDAAGGVKIYSLTQGAQSLYAGIQVTSSEIASEIRRAQEAESSIRQTADSIATRVSTAEGKVSTLEQTASSLTTRIGTAEGNISTLQQTADSLTSRIEAAEGKYSLIEQTATKVGMVVVTTKNQDGTETNKINVAGIVTELNKDNTTETVIQANKIVLNSNQTQIKISDIFSASSTVKAPAVHTAALYADSIETAAYGSGTSPDTEGSTVTMGTHLLSMQRGTGNNSLSVQFLGNGDADLDHYHVLTISEITTGNDAGKMQVKLGNPTRNVADATQNFKIADTAYYKSHVGIKTTGSWQWDDEEEKYYRTIAPNDGQSETIDLPTFTTSVGSFNSQHKATILFKGPNNHTVASAIADASELYSDAKDSVTLGDYTWSPYTQTTPTYPASRTVSVSTVGRATSPQLKKELDLYLTNSGNWSAEHKQAVYLRTGSASGTRWMAVTLDATSEYYLGKSSVLFTDSGWANGQRTIGISGRTDASGTANDETRTMNISVPNFSIYSAYDSGSGILTFSASAAAKDGTATVATGTGSSDYTLSSTALTLKSNAFVYDANSTYSGYLPIVYNSGGVFKVGNTSTISANVTQYNQRVVLGQPSATNFTWDDDNHRYTYQTDAAVSFGSTNVLTRSITRLTLNPTQAINYGKTLVKTGTKPTTITSNGTYSASSDALDGYTSVTVNVPSSSSNIAAKPDTITANGTYRASADNLDGYSSVKVAVPTTNYRIGAKTNDVTSNGTYYASADNLDGYTSFTVNVSTSGIKGPVEAGWNTTSEGTKDISQAGSANKIFVRNYDFIVRDGDGNTVASRPVHVTATLNSSGFGSITITKNYA